MIRTLIDTSSYVQGNVIKEVLDERLRQDAKFNEQNHDPFVWLTIISEELGETSQAALHDRFGGSHAGTYRTELVHTVATALSALECYDRNNKPSQFEDYFDLNISECKKSDDVNHEGHAGHLIETGLNGHRWECRLCGSYVI